MALDQNTALILLEYLERRADHCGVVVGRVEGKDVHLLPVKDRRTRVGRAKVKADAHLVLRRVFDWTDD